MGKAKSQQLIFGSIVYPMVTVIKMNYKAANAFV